MFRAAPARAAPPAPPSALQQLGRALFSDPTLSNPKGQSCASCHAQEAGWTGPDSSLNELTGVMPGAIESRFTSRKPPTIAYATFMIDGPPVFVPALATYVGGFFDDGRAANLFEQIPSPIENPNEMNNTPAGVAKAVASGPNAALFTKAFGAKASSLPVEEAFADIVQAIVAFEQSPTVSPFNSKYDEYLDGKAKLTPQELAGLQLFTGSRTGRPGGPAVKSATCVTCHTVESEAAINPDLFTSSAFRNTGIPKNPSNPFYKVTNKTADPLGYNALGAKYIDYGLGDYLYPEEHALPPGNIGKGANGQGDFLRIIGQFKTPTLRNVDLRPAPEFIKCYGHNGFFKSLPQIVHFYNTRNLTTVPGETINFTAANPYAHLKGKPLWPAPENPDPQTLINPTGLQGLIGNLGLTADDEANLVAFLQTLSDVSPP